MNNIEEISNDSFNPILDIVTTIQNKLNESSNEEKKNTTENATVQKTQGLNIAKLIETLNTQEKSTSINANASNTIPNFAGLDINSLMNFKNILGSNSTPDPRQNLLTSLKPFLRENRQKNIDTYIAILGMMKAFNIFNNKDRD